MLHEKDSSLHPTIASFEGGGWGMSQDMWVASRIWELPSIYNQWEKWRSQSFNHKELNSAKTPQKQNTDSPLEPPEKMQPIDTLIFSLVRTVVDFWPTEL